MARFAADLHQRIERNNIETAEHTDQRKVGEDSPAPGFADELAPTHWPVGEVSGRREEEIDPENRQSDRSERNETDLDLVTREPLARERAQADADGENCQQQRDDCLVRREDVLRQVRELGDEYCPE